MTHSPPLGEICPLRCPMSGQPQADRRGERERRRRRYNRRRRRRRRHSRRKSSLGPPLSYSLRTFSDAEQVNFPLTLIPNLFEDFVWGS